MSKYGLSQAPVFKEQGDIYQTSPFGKRTLNGKVVNHKGVDVVRYIGYNALATIVAIAGGKVTAVKNTVQGVDHKSNLAGNYVAIDHGGGIVTKYYHLKYGSIPAAVKVGATVKKGDTIGYMGNTGDSYGAHLHFQIEQNGTPIDGAPYLKGQKVIGGGNNGGTLKADLAVLQKKGVINSPDYWEKTAPAVKYLPDLIHNMAEALK